MQKVLDKTKFLCYNGGIERVNSLSLLPDGIQRWWTGVREALPREAKAHKIASGEVSARKCLPDLCLKLGTSLLNQIKAASLPGCVALSGTQLGTYKERPKSLSYGQNKKTCGRDI